MRQSSRRRVRSLRRRLRRKGSPEEQRARVKAHLRLGSCYVSINDALDALNREDIVGSALSRRGAKNRHSASLASFVHLLTMDCET